MATNNTADQTRDELHRKQTEATDSAESETSDPDNCHSTVSQQRQSEVLDRDGHQCRICGRLGPERGGLASLHIHHIERNPDNIDEDDPQNLTTLCRSCHNWIHLRSTPADSPTPLTDTDLNVLLPQDIEILQYLADQGPARTGDIVSALNIDLSVAAVRERLWTLMGLDNIVESRDQQIVDKDIETGEWGLSEQIETSARGHVPDDPRLLIQRFEDEQVRQAVNRGISRDAIMDVLDVSRRTTFNKEKRACAFGFPLSVFLHGNRESADRDVSRDDSSGEPEPESADGDQQRTLAETLNDDLEPIETWGVVDGLSTAETDSMAADEDQREADRTALREKLHAAIDALEAADTAL